MLIELIDFMGSDDRVVDAARVSFDKIAGNYTEGQNVKLINYLARHNHFTPFTHPQITMRETVPIFVARQRFKSSVGFTYNEVSRRYVDDNPEFYVPDVWRKRADNKKQGSSDEEVTKYEMFTSEELDSMFERQKDKVYPREHFDEFQYGDISILYDTLINTTTRVYNDLIKAGVAPEQARMVLPQSMYTSYYVTGSLAAWARAYKLRIAEDSQKEIQDLAKQWGEVIGNIEELKYSWAALTKD